MNQLVTLENLELYEIDEEFQDSFVPKHYCEYSDMESFLLKLVGNVLREKDSEWCWSDGNFEWWYNSHSEGVSYHHRVFLTDNGNLMYECMTTGQMWRVTNR